MLEMRGHGMAPKRLYYNYSGNAENTLGFLDIQRVEKSMLPDES